MVDSRSVEYEIRVQEEFSKSLKELSKLVKVVGKDVEGSLGQFEKQGQAVASLKAAISDLAAVQNELIRKSRLIESLQRSEQEFIDNKRAANDLKRTISDLEKEMAAVVKPTKEQNKQLKDLQRQYDRAETNLKKTVDRMEELSIAAQRAGVNINDLESEWRELSDAASQSRVRMNELKTTLREVQTGATKVGDSSRRAGAGLLSMSRSGRQSLSVFQRLRGEVIALATAYVGLQGSIRGIESLFETQRRLDAAQARFRVGLGGNDQAAANEIRFVREEAERLGLQFETLVEEYSKFVGASQGTALELEQLRLIFVGVTEAAAVNRISNDNLAGTFRALTQIISKGQVQAEELRGQLGDRLVGAVVDFANGLNITTAELNKLLEQGAITSDALVDFANELRRKYGEELPNAIESPVAKFNRLKNAITDLKVEILASGFIDELVADLDDLSETISGAEFREGARALGSALGTLVNVTVLVIENFETLGKLLAALVAAKIVSGLATAFFNLGSALVAVRTAFVGAGAVGLAAAGPGGWITLLAAAAGAATLAFLQLGDASDDVADRIAANQADLNRFFNPAVNPQSRLQDDEIADRISMLNRDLAELETRRAQFESASGSIISAFLGDDIEEIDEQIAKVKEQLEDFLRLRRGLAAGTVSRETGQVDLGGQSAFVAALGSDIQQIIKKTETAFANINEEIASRQANTIEERRQAINAEYAKILSDVTTAETAITERINAIQAKLDSGELQQAQEEVLRAQQAGEREQLRRFQQFRAAVATIIDEKQIDETTAFVNEKIREITQTAGRAIRRGGDVTADGIREGFQKLRNEVERFSTEEDLKLIDEAQLDALLQFTNNKLREISAAIADETKGTLEITVDEIRARYEALRAEIANAPEIDTGRIDAAEERSLRQGALAIEREINDVIRLRTTLVQNVREGNADVTSQNERVKEIEEEQNAILTQLIEKGKAYANALGDQQLLANLEAITNQLNTLNRVVLITGDQINDTLASGLTDAVDQWSDGVKDARDAFRDFARDFLRRIALMITQQAILNALQGGQGTGGGFGGAVASFINNALTRHQGGLVQGGGTRQVPAQIFANAPRLHSGGMVGGLRPGEVPVVAKVGEEVLSRRDPRNRLNAGSGDTVINVYSPDVASFRRSQSQIATEQAARMSAAARRNS